jgi:hypothetical protein
MNQSEIIDVMNYLGFDANKGGICAGIVMMRMEAVLGQKGEDFNNIINLMATLDTSNERTSSFSDLSVAEMLEMARQHITPDMAFDPKITELKTKEGRALSLEEKESIKLFCTKALKYFDPANFGEKELNQQNIVPLMQKLGSEDLKNQGGVVSLSENVTRCKAYNEIQLTTYLVKLDKMLNEVVHTEPITISLGSHNHRMNLEFHPAKDPAEKGEWVVFDPNRMPAEVKPAGEIAEWIREGFYFLPTAPEYTMFNAVVVSTSNNPDKAAIIAALQKADATLEQHENYAEKVGKESEPGVTLAAMAVTRNDPYVLKQLAETGQADFNQPYNGKSLLSYAITWGSLDMVETLVKRGANVFEENIYGQSLIHLAANSPKIVEFLATKGVDVNKVDSRGSTVFDCQMMDYKNADLELIKILCDNGLKVNDKSEGGGNSPLATARILGVPAICDILEAAAKQQTSELTTPQTLKSRAGVQGGEYQQPYRNAKGEPIKLSFETAPAVAAQSNLAKDDVVITIAPRRLAG